MFSIKDMMAAGSTTSRAVRWWEEQGLLGTVERTDAGHRRYTEKQLELAKFISAGRAAGMPLKWIEGHMLEWPALRARVAKSMDSLPVEYDL